MISAGDAFLVPENRAGIPSHFYVIVTSPLRNGGKVLLVNVTTWKDNTSVGLDDTCLLDIGDHPFIKHRSFIAYNCARVTPVSAIEEALRRGSLILKQPCSEQLLDRIRQGLLDSPFASPKHRAML